MSDLAWKKDIEQQIRTLLQRTAHLPTRTRGGGSGGAVGGIVGYRRNSKEELPTTDLPDMALGFVGPVIYVHNGADWQAVNEFE